MVTVTTNIKKFNMEISIFACSDCNKRSPNKQTLARHIQTVCPMATLSVKHMRIIVPDDELTPSFLENSSNQIHWGTLKLMITENLSKKVPIAYHVPSTEYSFRKKLLIEQIKSTDPDLFDNDVRVNDIFLSVFFLDSSSAASLERQYIWNIKDTGVYLLKEGDTAKLIPFNEARDMIMSSVRKIVDLLAASDDPEEDFPGRDKIKKILSPVGDYTWWDLLDEDLVVHDIMNIMIPSLSV